MRIRQALVLKSFEDSFHKRWGTHHPTSVKEPLIVFGLFHQQHVDLIAAWKAPVVVVWVGSDSLYLRNNTYGVDYSKILHAPHVKHVAISKWIIDDLSACGVPHIYLPITHVDFEQFKPAPLGDKIYCHAPNSRPEIYGMAIMEQVKKRLPDIEIIHRGSHVETPHFMMRELYDQCFIGLRPTSHDGQSTTVAELGLMGRKVIHNGLAPNCIPWRSVDDIVGSIRREQDRMQDITVSDNAAHIVTISKRVRKFLDIGDDWLDTDFYEQRVLQRTSQQN